MNLGRQLFLPLLKVQLSTSSTFDREADCGERYGEMEKCKNVKMQVEDWVPGLLTTQKSKNAEM